MENEKWGWGEYYEVRAPAYFSQDCLVGSPQLNSVSGLTQQQPIRNEGVTDYYTQ